MSAQMIDEDLINKSLLDSLNLQADAEPISSSSDDDEHLYNLRSRPDSPYRHHHHQQQQHSNSNPFNHYSSRATFNSFPNTNRRQQPLSTFYNNNSPHNSLDPYPQPYDPRTHPEHAIPQSNLNNPRSYLVDQFPSTSRPLSQQQPSSSTSFATGVSQTPYGPHVPSVAVPLAANTSTSTTTSNQQSNSIQNGSSNSTVTGEEISTIFVVGFPDDMQEREFQNMFTFSAGFEAATLKIPNKEYTAYGSLVQPPTALANGVPVALNALRGQTFQPYAASNDPYNLVTVNQGGVVVDGGRDGTMASWPAANPHALSEEALVNAHLFAAGPGGPIPSLAAAAAAAAAGQTSLSLPPRKQIIGFAKFRSRAEALQARDVLQGRRVDIEKGAVLKAEMAKKNLHTKRGVGPVAGVNVGGVTPVGLANVGMPLALGQNPSISSQHISDSFMPHDMSFSSNAPTAGHDAINHQSLSRLEEEHNRQRERENSITMSLMSAIPMSTSSSTSSTMSLNGRQDRQSALEEEERQRETWARRRSQQEKDNTNPPTRLRNSSSYDFNHIPIGSVGINKSQNGVNGSSTGSVKEGSITDSPMLEYEGLNQLQSQLATHHEAQEDTDPSRRLEQHQEKVVRPWDQVNLSSTASGLLSPTQLAPARPRSESQESDNPHAPPGDFPVSGRASAIGTPAPIEPSHSISSISSSSPPGNGTADYINNPFPPQSRLNGFSSAAKPAESSVMSTVPPSVTSPSSTHSLPPIAASSSISSTGQNGAVGSNNGANYSNGQSSTGTTSPQLPSPASGGSLSSSNLSLMGGGNAGLAHNLGGSGAGGLRGTVDQNPPINTLYVGNLPTSPPPAGYPNDYLEDTLRDLFQVRPGFRKLCFRHKANGPMCFVEFEDVHYAARAMQEMTGNTLRGVVKNGIRLSYSKNPLGVRTPTSAGSNGGPTMQQQQQLMQTLSNHHNQHQAIAHHLSQAAQHHVVHQSHPSQQHHQQHQSQLSYTSSVGGHDPFRLPEELAAPHHRPNVMMRRDSQLGNIALQQSFNGMVNGATSPVGAMPNGFYSSGANQQPGGQPPRFYTTSPPGTNVSSTLTGSSSVFVPRLGGLNGTSNFGPGAAAFAPFGVPEDGGGFGMMDHLHQHHQ